MSIAFILMLTSLAYSAGNTIEISENRKELIAPKGDSYEWYLNDELLMNQHDKNISVEQSGTYEVKYETNTGEKESLKIKVAVTADGIRTIHVIGDSTVQTYRDSDYPFTGWGQVIQLFFDESQLEVINYAIGGRSSRSFWEQDRWTPVKNALKTGDFVFIQWGHNDRDYSKEERYTPPEDYKDYLRLYVNESRAKGAIPILISPMTMNGRNVFTESGSDYRGAMLDVATELDVHFIDLNLLSWALNQKVGVEHAKYYMFMGLEPGEYPNYPDGYSDFWTHFQEMGALNMATLIIDGLESLDDSEDEDLVFLQNAAKERFLNNIYLDNPKAGEVTYPINLPEGAHVTIKTTINLGNSFVRWEDGDGNIITSDRHYEYTSPPNEVTYKAITIDCMGNEGGSGYFDACNVCIDSVLNFEECVDVVNRACSTNGSLVTKTEFGKSISYYQLNAGQTDTVTYTMRAGKEDDFTVGFKYTNSAAGQTVDVYLDNRKFEEGISLEPAGDSPIAKQFDFNLTKENHEVKFIFPDLLTDINIGMALIKYDPALYATTCEIEFPDPLSADEVLEGITISSNPFSNTATLRSRDPLQYRILSLSGQTLETGQCVYECAIGQLLKPGSYILQTSNGGQSKGMMIIKK